VKLSGQLSLYCLRGILASGIFQLIEHDSFFGVFEIRNFLLSSLLVVVHNNELQFEHFLPPKAIRSPSIQISSPLLHSLDENQINWKEIAQRQGTHSSLSLSLFLISHRCV
jgi:hypothetical protein